MSETNESNQGKKEEVLDAIAKAAVERTDQNQVYSLRVKSEYVGDQRPSCLGPIPEQFKLHEDDDNGGDNGDDRKDDRDGGGRNNNNNNSRRNKKKNKQFNKKRPRDTRQAWSEKICMSVIKNVPCQYGAEKCRFSHDMVTYMKTRPEDIQTELLGKDEVGMCPNYKLHGYCVYGAMCRFGKSHIAQNGENIIKEGSEYTQSNMPLPDTSVVVNLIPREIQNQLRKRTYPFVRKRFYEDREDKKMLEEAEREKAKKEQENEEKQEATDGDGGDVGGSNDATETTTATAPAPATKSSSSSSSTPVELKTRKIIDFSNKVYVAPLTTVGNLPFRRIMKRFGADITCGEMAVASCLLEGKNSEWALLKRHPEEDIYGIQIAAGHPDQYTRVAEVVEKYTTVDFVDLNLGCPLDLICNKGAGAMLMTRDNKLRQSLVGITRTLSCPITIKMRTGWEMKSPFAHKLVPKIQKWNIDGVAAIMVSAFVTYLLFCFVV